MDNRRKNDSGHLHGQAAGIAKTAAAGVGVGIFCLLNVVLFLNAEHLIPDERTRRLLWFSINPEFWQNWVSQFLWTLAAGFLLSLVVRLQTVQKRLAAIRIPFSLRKPKFVVRWLEKNERYPVEYFLLSYMRKGFLQCQSQFHTKNIPALILVLSVLCAAKIILVNTIWGNFLISFFYAGIVFIPGIPSLLLKYFYIYPLTDLLITGSVSWKLFLIAALAFLAVTACFRYGQRIKRSARRKEHTALIVRYAVGIAGLVVLLYAAGYIPLVVRSVFFVICLPFVYLDEKCHWLRFYLYEICDKCFVIPFYLWLNEGILTVRLIVSVSICTFLTVSCYWYFRRIFYSPERWKKLYRTARILAVPFLLVWLLFYHIIAVVFSQASNGMSQIYRYLIDVPSNVWDCIYFAPCCFLYYSVVSWKLFVFPCLLFVFSVGFYRNPFHKIFRTVPFSPRLFYITCWTVLFCTCFSVLLWKLILFMFFIAVVHYVASQGLTLPPINTAFLQDVKRILYRILVVSLALFDTAIVLWDLFIAFRYYYKLYLYFFIRPVAEFFRTGQFSWTQLIPALIFTAVFFLLIYSILLKRPMQINATVPQCVFFVSILALVLLFSTAGFLYIYVPDTSISWLDIRFIPCWALLFPVFFITFSVSGLMLIDMKKTGVNVLLIALIITLPSYGAAYARRITILEPAKSVSGGDVRRIMSADSLRSGSGYSAEQKIVDCFAAMEYRYTGGRYKEHPVKFRMRMPGKIKPERTYPLIVWFHGRGESGNDNTRQLAHLQKSIEFFAGANQRDFFMLATQCPADNNQWERSLSQEDSKGDAPLTITGEILETVIREYPIDVNRISVCGLSSGGNAAWEFINRHPRRFAAFAPGSGRPPQNATPEPYLNTVIWAFNNNGDTGTPYGETERFIEMINANGGNAYLTLYDASGHDAWSPMQSKEKIIGWLILQNLAKPGPPQGIVCRPLSKTSQFWMFGLPVCLIIFCIVLPVIRKKSVR